MDQTLTLSYVFPYSVETIFSKYSDPDALARWWGPHGFTNTFHEFDFRAGGKWVFTMSDGKADYLNEHIFHVIEPTRIVMEHIVEPVFTLEVLLEIVSCPPDQGGGEAEGFLTKMTWISTFAHPEFLETMRDFLIEKNGENFARLEAELQKF